MRSGRIDLEQNRPPSLLDRAIFETEADRHFRPNEWWAGILRKQRRPMPRTKHERSGRADSHVACQLSAKRLDTVYNFGAEAAKVSAWCRC